MQTYKITPVHNNGYEAPYFFVDVPTNSNYQDVLDEAKKKSRLSNFPFLWSFHKEACSN